MLTSIVCVCVRALHWVPIPMPMPTHTHGFWVGMGAMLLYMGGHWFCASLHLCIQLQIRVKILDAGNTLTKKRPRLKPTTSERPYICPILSRLGVGG